MKGFDAWLTNDRAGDHDGECGAYSYAGTFQCTLPYDHEGRHTQVDEDGGTISWLRRVDDFDEDGMPTVRP